MKSVVLFFAKKLFKLHFINVIARIVILRIIIFEEIFVWKFTRLSEKITESL